MAFRSRLGAATSIALLVLACETAQMQGSESGGTGGSVSNVGHGGAASSSDGHGGAASSIDARGGAVSSLGGAAVGGAPDAVGGNDGDGFAGAAGAAAIFEDSSWDTTLAITVTHAEGPLDIHCTNAKFTVHVTPTAEGLRLISGRDGDFSSIELEHVTDEPAAFEVSPSTFQTQIPALPTGGGDCTFKGMELEEFFFEGRDTDADGAIDALWGSGSAGFNTVWNDMGVSADLKFTLTGVPDTTPATLVGESEPHHPLDWVFYHASEPVSPESRVQIANGDDSIDLTASGSYPGWFAGFYSQRILPFGTQWTSHVVGTDLASPAFDLVAPPPLQVIADPGLFQADGFETTPTALLVGDARVVTGIGTLPPISGAHSLFVGPGAEATFHLARREGASSVRLSVSTLGYAFAFPIRAGVIGGETRVDPPLSFSNTAVTPTDDPTWPQASPPKELILPLAESGPDVVVRIAPPGACIGSDACRPLPAFLIDDLRVE